MERYNVKSRNALLPALTILIILILITGITFAWLTLVLNGTKVNRIKAGTLELTLDDNASNGIDLEYAIPQSNEQGLNNDAYTFTVRNTGNMNAEYKLFLEDEEIEGTRISDSNIKYNLVKNNGEDNPKLLSTTIEDNKRVLDSTIIDGNSTNTYSLKLWIDSEATQEEVANKVFKARIKLEAVQSENSSEDKYDVEGTITKDGEVVTSGTVVVYPGGETSEVDNEGNFNIPNLDYGNYNAYYVPDGNNTNNMTEEQIKNTPGVIPTKIIVNPGNRTITPGQGYEIVINVTKKPKNNKLNTHIKAVYRYNEEGEGTGPSYTGCLGGEEAGCEQISIGANDTVPFGTIVKYEVKPGVEKYFNVLYDNGDTLTMQQRENTISSVAWYADSNDNTKGPLTALAALENATNDWEYVNDQTYTAGTTTFGTDKFASSSTRCDFSGETEWLDLSHCTNNAYTLAEKIVKARMITAQEASEMGSRSFDAVFTLIFMRNYLDLSGVSFSGSAYDSGYWTMSAWGGSTQALAIDGGGVYFVNTSNNSNYGARAVVIVDK